MNKQVKKALSVFIAVLMAVSAMPFAAFADASQITLSIDEVTSFYAGKEYSVTATITGVEYNDVLKDVSSAFTWEALSEDVTIVSQNDFSYVSENVEDSSYTISETAKFVLVGSVGTDTGIRISYEKLAKSKTKEFTILQPINTVTIDSVTGSDISYIESAQKLFMERVDVGNTTAVVDYTVDPDTNEDEIIPTCTNYEGVVTPLGIVKNTSVSISINKNRSLTPFDLELNTASGAKKNVININPCLKCTSFQMSVGGATTPSEKKATEEDEGSYNVSVVQGKDLVIFPTGKSPSATNDEFSYSLEYDGRPSNDFKVDGSTCTLKNSNPGTYTLTCVNMSKGSTEYGNGESLLERKCRFVVNIVVQEAKHITDFSLYQLDENDAITGAPLTAIPTLYLNTSANNTFNLSKCLVITPEVYTDTYHYETSNKAVASVSEDGIVSAVGSGEAMISIVNDDNSSIFAVCPVKVVVGIKSIDRIDGDDTLIAGNSIRLTPVTTPSVHDEEIGWTVVPEDEKYTGLVTVDQNGFVSASEGFDFGDDTEAYVNVVATTKLGKVAKAKSIRVLPLDKLGSDAISVLVRNKNGILAPEENGEFKSYVGQYFTIAGNARTEQGTVANRKMVWKVRVGEHGSLEDVSTFGSVTAQADGSYRIDTNINDITSTTRVTYYCYATVNGTVRDDTPYKAFTVKIVAPVTRIILHKEGQSASYTSDNFYVGRSTVIQVEAAPAGTIDEDSLEVSVSDDGKAIVDVEQLSDTTFRITAKKRGTAAVFFTTSSGTVTSRFNATVYENIDYAEAELDCYEYVYDGKAHIPSLTRLDFEGTSLLATPSAYGVAYKNNVNAASEEDENAPAVVITGKAEYSSSTKEVRFRILPKEIVDDAEEFTITPTASSFVINDTEVGAVATFRVKDVKRDVTLTQGRDYEILCQDNKRAGTGTAIIKGIGNYQGEIEREFSVIDKAELFEISDIEDCVFDGNAKTPEPEVKYYDEVLVKGVDYTLAYANNVNAAPSGISTAPTVTVRAMGRFTGNAVVKFTILPKQMVQDNFTITVSNSSNIIDVGAESVEPTFNVLDIERNKGLARNTDYTVEYENNTQAGIGTATLTGNGNYEGTVTTQFFVKAKAESFEIDEIPDQIYTGSPISPEPNVYYKGRLLEKDVDYKIEYPYYHTDIGRYNATIKGIGDYFTGSQVKSFNIITRVIESENALASAEVVANSLKDYGFLEKNGEEINYVGDNFTVSAVGKDAQGKVVDCEYTMYFSCENGERVAFDKESGTRTMRVNGTIYFQYTYNKNNQAYTIIPSSLLNDVYIFNFFCEATKDATTVSARKDIRLVPKSGIRFNDTAGRTTVTVPTRSIIEATASFRTFYGGDYDEIRFESSNPAIATVEADADFATNHKVWITANQDRETMKTGQVIISAIRRDGEAAKLTVNVRNNIADAECSGVSSSYSYTGGKIIVSPVLTFKGSLLTENLEYKVSIDGVNAGVATITITGIDPLFAGTKVVTTRIVQKSIASSDITASFSYDNNSFVLTDTVREATPTNIVVRDTTRNVNLVRDVDYTLSYSSNRKAGTGTVIITGIGNYSGRRTIAFNVIDQASRFTVAAIADQYFNNLQKTPKPVVKYDGKTLTEGRDYTLEYKNNINVGTAAVVITGIGSYTGRVEKPFKINPKKTTGLKATARTNTAITLVWTADNGVTGYQIVNVGTGKVVATVNPGTTSTLTLGSLKAQTAYTFKVRSYCDIYGVRYYGAYSDLCYTSTVPKAPSVTLKTSSKTVKASWKKISGVSGYEYQISLKSNFSGAKTVKLGASATSRTTKSLKKGKKYYVRVRAYKTIKINGKSVKVYSKWTKKSIKCK